MIGKKKANLAEKPFEAIYAVRYTVSAPLLRVSFHRRCGQHFSTLKLQTFLQNTKTKRKKNDTNCKSESSIDYGASRVQEKKGACPSAEW